MKYFQQLCFILVFSYLLGISDGYISLWIDDQPKPVYISSYKAENLPRADQQALEKGIHIQNKEELLRLLEDYLS